MQWAGPWMVAFVSLQHQWGPCLELKVRLEEDDSGCSSRKMALAKIRIFLFWGCFSLLLNAVETFNAGCWGVSGSHNVSPGQLIPLSPYIGCIQQLLNIFFPLGAMLHRHCLAPSVISGLIWAIYFSRHNSNQVSERLIPVKRHEKAVAAVPTDCGLKQTWFHLATSVCHVRPSVVLPASYIHLSSE